MASLRSIPNLSSFVACTFVGAVLLAGGQADDEVPKTAPAIDKSPERVSVDEARGRAKLLHEVIRGALQVVHRDFFDPDNRDRIPSASLEDMFEVVKEEQGVGLKWLGVNAKIMDADHKAEGEFETKAVAALAGGAPEFEAVEGDRFRYVGPIRLHNTCLKCHVPHRTSLETRLAGLSITVPIERDGGAED